MDIIPKNIRFLRETRGWTQKELAIKIGSTRSMIGAYEEGRSIPLLPIALKLADIFEIALDSLVKQCASENSEKNLLHRGQNILAITVNSNNNENIELVTYKASAGYLSGYQDTEYVKELPKLFLPFLTKHATYRAFEISGESMLPVKPGSIVIGEFVENLSSIENGSLYVVVTKSEGIIYKRLYNFLNHNGQFLMVSDNLAFDPYMIDPVEILQVWKQRKIIADEIGGDSQYTLMSKEGLAKLVVNSQYNQLEKNANNKSKLKKTLK